MNESELPTAEAGWLRTPLTDSTEIARRYDDWAATYDHELVNEWNYDAPGIAAGLIADRGITGPVLDVGCGTGLTGAALASVGIFTIDGVDISEVSLRAARTRGIYRTLTHHDFNQDLFPASDNTYDAAICVGVLSYAHDPQAVIGELCRVVRPNGTIVFTHRIDLWDTQQFDVALLKLRDDARLLDATWTEPQPYMPGNAELADLRVRYVTVTVA